MPGLLLVSFSSINICIFAANRISLCEITLNGIYQSLTLTVNKVEKKLHLVSSLVRNDADFLEREHE